MAFRCGDVKGRDLLKLFGPFLGLAIVGFVGRAFYPVYWCWSDFAFALFDALAIAGLLGVGLELYSTKFLIENAAAELTEKLVGRGLPRELQKHIREITNEHCSRSLRQNIFFRADSRRTNYIRYQCVLRGSKLFGFCAGIRPRDSRRELLSAQIYLSAVRGT
jgi:hypothetical protein